MLHLDDLDVRIIREFNSPNSPQWNVRESYAKISRSLGVDEETVRLRMKRMREGGAFPAWRLMVNPHLLDGTIVSLELEVDEEERKAKAISQIRLVDGVTKIIDFSGKGLLVTVLSEEGETLQRRIQLIESICGSKSTVWKSRFPRPGVRMKKIDWRIVDALRNDARKDLEDVAHQLGVSTRTIQRRLSAMEEGKAIYVSGGANVQAVGGLMCCFLVHCPDRTKKRAVDSAIRTEFGRVGNVDTSPEEHSIFGRHCENLADSERVLGGLKAIDGVQRADMHVMKEIIHVEDSFKREIESHVSTH